MFCVREEPVLFLRMDNDFIPFTPRAKENLKENLHNLHTGVKVEDLEVSIRKEVIFQSYIKACCIWDLLEIYFPTFITDNSWTYELLFNNHLKLQQTFKKASDDPSSELWLPTPCGHVIVFLVLQAVGSHLQPNCSHVPTICDFCFAIFCQKMAKTSNLWLCWIHLTTVWLV